MEPEQSTSLEAGTRERLLSAAGEVFADRGFRDATVREICRAAGVNIAAVNYHFGDKETLYREVIQFAGCAALEKYPIGEAGAVVGTPEDRLRGFIRNYLDRLLDEGRPAWHGKLIAREMVEPTQVLDDLVAAFVRPQHDRVRAIVSELLGAGATDEQIRMCVISVVSQCVFYKNCRPMIERLLPEHRYDSATRARLAEHVAAFSLGAIAALRGRTGERR